MNTAEAADGATAMAHRLEQPVDIMGIPVRTGQPDAVVAFLDQEIAARRPVRLAFLNAHLSNVAAGHPSLRQRLSEFTVLNDGIGLDIARRVLHGQPFPANLNGTDLVSTYLSRSRLALRLFLLGARPEVVARAAEAISRRWPRHSVVGIHHGFLAEEDEAMLAAQIALVRPDLLLVGMGNPRQEQFIARRVPAVCPSAIALGAWFDFVSGAIPRAPPWIRRARLEWVYRLAIEPRRMARRYLIGNVQFLGRLALARWWTPPP